MRLFVGVITLIVLVGCFDAGEELCVPSDDTRFYIVGHNGESKHFNVPRNYFYAYKLEDNHKKYKCVKEPKEVSTFKLELLFPSLSGKNFKNFEQFNVKGHGDRVLVFASSNNLVNGDVVKSGHDHIKLRFEVIKKSLGSYGRRKDSPIYGDTPTSLGRLYGLEAFGYEPGSFEKLIDSKRFIFYPRTAYLNKSNGEYVSVLTCGYLDQPPPVVSPSCRHSIFIDELSLYIDLLYSARKLNEWLEIENSIRKLFLGFSESRTLTP